MFFLLRGSFAVHQILPTNRKFLATIRSGELKKAGEIEQDAGEIEQRESAS